MYNIDFLSKFIPPEELDTLIVNTNGEEGDYFKNLLENTEKTIKTIPNLYANEDKGLKGSKVYLHYFVGDTDIYISELDLDSMAGFGFACINGDKYNAELGYQYLPEIVEIEGMNLDLYWDTNTTLADIVEKYKGKESK